MSNALLSRGHGGLTAPAVAVLATLLTPVPLMAESQMAATVAHGALGLRVVVPPVFRILEVRPQPDHDEVRVWTNMASVRIGEREYRFAQPGENVLRLPRGAASSFRVHGL